MLVKYHFYQLQKDLTKAYFFDFQPFCNIIIQHNVSKEELFSFVSV